jgi:hypothetical protein
MSNLESVREPFRALASVMVPQAAGLTKNEWHELEAIVERALASRPPLIARQLRLLIRLLDVAAHVMHGRPLASLDPVRRARLLSRFEHARLLLVRRGVWGLRTLVMMGYYTRPGAADEVGYRATPAGWSARQ